MSRPIALFFITLCVAGTAWSADSVSVTPDSRAVRIGSSAALTIQSSDPLDPGWTYAWQAERGTVAGAGATATYTATAGLDPGYDVVTVTVSENGTPLATRYCVLYIYQQFVILKADDWVSYKSVVDHWKYYLEQVVDTRHLKTSVGILSRFLDPAWNNAPTYAQDIQYTVGRQTEGYVEFFNHGYDHSSGTGWYEFSGSTYEFQQSHFDLCQTLSQSVLGRVFTTFGPPFNLTDASTLTVVNNSPDTVLWFYGPASGSNALTVIRAGEIESTMGVPSYSRFLATYSPTRPVVALQHHPYLQTFRDGFAEFNLILDHLVAGKATFILPSEYARLAVQGILPTDPGADSDSNGIPDRTEGAGDADYDGLPNFMDADSDGDGILDEVEGTGDSDTDGTPNYLDTDANGNGITDDVEGTGDDDNDGIPNFLDRPGFPIDPQSFSVLPDTRVLRAGESVALHVSPPQGLSPLWTYQWSTSQGSVSANGSTATYTAPAVVEPGGAVVTVKVLRDGQVLGQKAATLWLYNQLIMLKADDWQRTYYVTGGVSQNWANYAEYMIAKKVKTSMGVITRSLDSAWPPDSEWSGDDQFAPFVAYTQSLHDTGYFEFWHHGYDHQASGNWHEFHTTTYDHQKFHLEEGLRLSREVLGFPIHTFAAPFNWIDATTTQVVNESQDVQVWMYGLLGSTKMLLNDVGVLMIESTKTGMPNYAGFVQLYQPAQPYLVLQHHPDFDDFANNFDQFDQIITYLQGRKVTFMHPIEYYNLFTNGAFPFEVEGDSDADGILDPVDGQGDPDEDGLFNFLDGDSDNDGIPDGTDGTADSNGNGVPNFLDPDLKPAIVTQPEGATVDIGQPITLSLTATGSAPLSYQWYLDSVAIHGAIQSSYAISAFQVADAGSYTCVVSNRAGDYLGNATSEPAVLVAGNPPGDVTKPVLTLLGNANVTVQVGAAYTDAGATATDDTDGDITASIAVTGNVDTAVLGSYTLAYNVSDAAGNAAVPVSRTVNVVDTTKPVITLLGADQVTVTVNAAYTDPGATATDNYDGNLTAGIVRTGSFNTAVVGTYTLTYDVTDSSGNAAVTATRTVRVIDFIRPVITLIGNRDITIQGGPAYTDAGATATDNYDGDLTSQLVMTSNVNTRVIGVYQVTYNVSDSSGNTATPVTRIVRVVDTTRPVIKLIGSSPLNTDVLKPYVDPGATATDNLDGNISSNIVVTGNVNTSVLGTYTVTYNVKDNAGNAAKTVYRTVRVVDRVKPVITVLGASVIYVKVNTSYSDPGATAYDNYDGDITSKIVVTNRVNTKVIGSYRVSYDVKDSSGNTAYRVGRTVNVGR